MAATPEDSLGAVAVDKSAGRPGLVPRVEGPGQRIMRLAAA